MPTVLFADADREFRDVYAWLLSSYGFRVETAADGLECLGKLRHFVPDLLILNLELPWGGGEGVLAVMEDPRLLPARVVLTSAVASAQALDGLASPPRIQGLSKPFRLSTLVERMGLAALIEQEQPSTGIQSRGILVVDDDPGVRNLLQTHLEHLGFRVWTAGDGEEALDHCCDHGEEIAVVLLDVLMPHRDGPQTLEGILKFNPEMPVCFMAGDPGEYEANDLVARGARHFFRKPFCIDEVIRVVRHLANEPMRELQEH
jgi:CheY-like chemotaxis protein